MRLSFFSHRATLPETNSRELRRDDVECFTEREIRRQVHALEDDGWELTEILEVKEVPASASCSGKRTRTRR